MNHLNNTHRRKFLKNSFALGIGLTAAGSLLESFSLDENIKHSAFKTGFDQEPLPYSYNALEDSIDAATMEIHYTKHAAGYSKNLKEAAAAEGAASKSVEDILASISKYSVKMRNNAGGHYNHEMFWKLMRPKQEGNKPDENLIQSIEKYFSSFDNFKIKFSDAAKTRFGSGWAWLYADKDKNLMIGSTPNQDNPLMDISDIKGTPLLGLDVWEHAYYLKYQNRRADYIENWWSLVNWNYVQKQYNNL